jgi:hypothetical protein
LSAEPAAQALNRSDCRQVLLFYLLRAGRLVGIVAVATTTKEDNSARNAAGDETPPIK